MLRHLPAAALLALGLTVSAPAAQAQTGGLSDTERVILGEVLRDVLGPTTDPAIIDDEAETDDDEPEERNARDKGKGKGKSNGLPPGLAKRDSLPPGLAKRDSLPPGLAKRLDDRLEDELPDRDVEVEDEAVIIRDKETGAVVEVIKDILILNDRLNQ